MNPLLDHDREPNAGFELDQGTLLRIRAAAQAEGISFEEAVHRIVRHALPALEREVLGRSFGEDI